MRDLDQEKSRNPLCARTLTPVPLDIKQAGFRPTRAITGNCSFSTEGLGITPGNQFSLIQCSEKQDEGAVFGSWFTSLWNSLPTSDEHKFAFLARLLALAEPKAPALIYYLTLFQIFKDRGDELDEERIVKSATGIRNTTVWKKLYKFSVTAWSGP